ncbi:hypothetical protein [Fluviicola sp.]|uniref:hypothetical protein n=1 Tax=Fluviicola sp. TaxID=1917219 RepID=UPI002610CC2F|nr:hypothetical protein [Fluviicola sp.]
MIKLVLSLISMGTFQNFTAQETEKSFFVGNVISDTSSCKDDGYRFGLTSILKSEYPIEIRFINSGFRGFSGAVLCYDSVWSVKIKSFDFRLNAMNWKIKEETRNLDSLFSELVSHNIFSLPDQSDLKMKRYYYNPKTGEFIGEGMGVGCGAHYTIEFKIGDWYRRYSCSSPEAFAEFYPNVHELKDYVNIVRIFEVLIKE